ncbi:LacI family DNA-binding transcriptional regulator [Telmatospirillum sp.]|uniref:LacI family DNA-binding transcriptional regulator n=1 Tax=Telmatospirillum sp. TaxID=2079197 RepID=UPI002847AB17|nr:LacI family DNA-binding transcriptional regulator [Telmatospirillum sp.]MDR3437035.1 LacI family DNA-binding transcriptional regulator [Telmatospirillum sp.]
MPKTIKEIASETGVSITTVRLVIGGNAEKYRISVKTQKLVNDYIAIHGYVLHHAARSLKLKRSDAVGFVVPDLGNPFFARLMAAMERHCRSSNLVLLSASTNDDPELETRTIDNFLARDVDGLIIAPCQFPTHKQLLNRKPRIAVVMVDRDYPQDRFPSVASDNVGSSLALTRRMISETNGPVDFFCAYTTLPSIRDRISGFSTAMIENGRMEWPNFVHSAAEDSVASGRKLIRELMQSRGALPRAFMTSSLLVLEGVMQEVKTATGTIPGDLLIGTFDDHAMLDFLPNRIYSVVQNEKELAALAFESIEGQMKNNCGEPRHMTVESRIVCRN